MDENTDTSLSFLEPLSNSKHIPCESVAVIPISPTIIDPDFINCILSIPKKIENLFCKIEKINFVYKIVSVDFISITYTTKVGKFDIFVDYFENFNFPEDAPSNIIFIIGRQNYCCNEKNLNTRKYKNSVLNGSVHSQTSIYKELRQKYLKYQIDKNINIVYIENSADLHNFIKNISVIAQKDKKYFPKVKSYVKDKKQELMMGLLKQISGISESVARCLCEEYKDLRNLRRKLIVEEFMMRELIIYDENRVNKRVLGEKIVNKLKRAFLSENGNEKV